MFAGWYERRGRGGGAEECGDVGVVIAKGNVEGGLAGRVFGGGVCAVCEQQGGDFLVAAFGSEHQRRVALKVGFRGVGVCAVVKQQADKGEIVHFYRTDDRGLGAVPRADVGVGSRVEQQDGDGKFGVGGDIAAAVVAVGEGEF